LSAGFLESIGVLFDDGQVVGPNLHVQSRKYSDGHGMSWMVGNSGKTSGLLGKYAQDCRILYMYIWDCFCFFESSRHPMCNFPCIIPQHWPQELPSLREHPGFSSSLAVELPVVDVVVASDGDKWAGTSLKFRTIYF
jgi:hypothetical protein